MKLQKNEFDALAKRAEVLAIEYHKKYGGCSQVVLAALKDALSECSPKHGNVISDDIVLAATGFAGGVGRSGYTCGALSGGIMAISAFWGRPYCDLSDTQKKRPLSLAMAKKLVDKFNAEYNSPNCSGILQKTLGKSYNFWVKEEADAFAADGGHSSCSLVSGNSVRWVLEILNEEGLI